MKYVLMQKNFPVAKIEIDSDDGRLTGVGEIFNKKRLPLSVKYCSEESILSALKSWWNHRSIPISRSGIDNALREMNLKTTQELLAKCMGLSLSDQYWVKPIDSDITWGSVNFFDNDFSDDVGNILFGNKPNSQTLNMMSPDGASNGWLKKKWKIINGERCLVKGGSNFFQEPFNEVISYKIAQRLGIDHTLYTLAFEGKNHSPVSLCRDFVTRDTELISAGMIASVSPKSESESKYEHFKRCCEILKIPNYKESLESMLVLDYLIVNQDRHMGNFGALRNADTLEFVGFAPIYDCGTSLRYDTPTVYIEPNLDVESQPFASFHDEQIKLVESFKSLDLSKLTGIQDEIAKIFSDPKAQAYIDEARTEKILEVVQTRIRMLEQIISQNFSA